MFAVPVMTSAAPAATAQELELEHAELLPARGKPSWPAGSTRSTRAIQGVPSTSIRIPLSANNRRAV